MNIKGLNKLNESINNKSDLNESDLFNYIDNVFPDNPISWKQATQEILDMATWIYEVVYEYNGESKAEPLKDKTKSKTPKEWNTKHKNRIKTGFKLLNNHTKDLFFERFGHWITNWKFNQEFLNENQKQITLDEDKEIEDVLKIKGNQFTFDCGVFMGTISSGLKNKFGLLWHAENTTNLGFFLSSVDNFIVVSGNKLTSNDIEKLTNHYVKYYFKDNE